jgi:hypothetical protein
LFNAKVQNYFVGCLLFAAYFSASGKPLAINYLRGDDLRRCKRCSFAVQKVAFWRVKDGLSQCKRWPFVNLFTVNRKLRNCFDFFQDSFYGETAWLFVNVLSVFPVVSDCYFRRLAR